MIITYIYLGSAKFAVNFTALILKKESYCDSLGPDYSVYLVFVQVPFYLIFCCRALRIFILARNCAKLSATKLITNSWPIKLLA